MKVAVEELRTLVQRALEAAGANETMAASTARALVLAESQGIGSHGLSRVAQYATHLKNGRCEVGAHPRVVSARGGAALVDAGCGLAFPACDMAVREAIERARSHGVANANRAAGDDSRVSAAEVKLLAAAIVRERAGIFPVAALKLRAAGMR